MTIDFRNEPILDFSRDEPAREALQKAIDTFTPVDCPLIIGGARWIATGQRTVSTR